MKQNGNVLFLILIAVALFAALSYAVTKSTSGSGSVSKEKLALSISELLQQSSTIKTEIMRRNINGDGIWVSTGVGQIFEPGIGAPVFATPISVMPAGSTDSWTIVEYNVEVDGVDVGTSDLDYLLQAEVIEDVCIDINKSLQGGAAIPAFSVADNSPVDGNIYPFTRTGAIVTIAFVNYETVELATYSPPACYTASGRWYYMDVVLTR